ncbi:MAG: hypothetical protein A2498_03555 [Lentisphaerae bacterium RIFOXYC12_FULL_60_16]|nr:MAG: hypothetical protein A2498_03555 [Lentisphaerae bacterium RIFOXYC12_FULL_60_16]OGV83915.1 MAG: hypothetical protein A2340_11675 [Lentisphaerae bacterium RIFOXYB12_FULL_60_10]
MLPSVKNTASSPATLVVIPTNPLAAYEAKGLVRLREYYNPTGLFEQVHAVSPLETGTYQAYGMTVHGVKQKHFKRQLQAVNPTIVRAYGGYWQADLACRYRLPGVPVVVSLHDAPPVRPHPSIRYADHVICMSQAVAAGARTAGVDPQRIHILSNRVDRAIFKPPIDPKSPQRVRRQFPAGKMILHIGRPTPQKNLDTLLRALARLPVEYFCVCIGRGDQRPFRQLAHRLNVDSRCQWFDSVPNNQLPDWYAACDCFCVPSRYEGFGIVFIEAAACGAAILTSRIAPMTEYLTHRIHAHLIEDYEDPAALAAAIRTVCENDDYRKSLQHQAPRAAAPFDTAQVDAQEADRYRHFMSLSARTLSRRQQLDLILHAQAADCREQLVSGFWSLWQHAKSRMPALRRMAAYRHRHYTPAP